MRTRFPLVGVIAVLAVMAAAAGCVVTTRVAVGPDSSAGLEYGMNRGGMDYRDFDLPSARPEDCRDACLADNGCAAFTYVNPGVQGANARCWLKNPVPSAVPDNCCVSGVKPVAPGPVVSRGGVLEPGTNRGGSDYRDFEMASPTPEVCRDACMAEPRCLAFTYVNPGVQGPNARCWLKDRVPGPTPDSNCTSGVK